MKPRIPENPKTRNPIAEAPIKGHKVKSLIMYEGPSLIDESPIVVVATGLGRVSKNAKTGAMIQIWILARDLSPLEANRTGRDYGICGSCPHRGIPHTGEAGTAKRRSCYVQLQNAPLSVWKAYQRGAYSHFSASEHVHLFRDREVRMGAYGDPSAVPTDALDLVYRVASKWTGYTHQASVPGIIADPRLMRSADSLTDARGYWAVGERTFRVLAPNEAKAPNEIWCPATPEGGMRASCAECGLCSGSRLPRAKSIAIRVHGSGSGAFAGMVRG